MNCNFDAMTQHVYIRRIEAFASVQSQVYLYQQLYDFKNRQRPSGIMALIAQKLSDQQMKRIAAYYASVTGPGLASYKIKTRDLKHAANSSAVGSTAECRPVRHRIASRRSVPATTPPCVRIDWSGWPAQ